MPMHYTFNVGSVLSDFESRMPAVAVRAEALVILEFSGALP